MVILALATFVYLLGDLSSFFILICLSLHGSSVVVVLQGSILGILLFCTCINDLPYAIYVANFFVMLTITLMTL